MSLLPHIEIEPATPATVSVLILHGLGASGHDFEPLIPELQLPTSAAVRFILPHAPSIPVTINGGYVMPAWYDILAMDLHRTVDEAQLLASAQATQKFIDREIERGIDSRRIIVAGFSQGGAVALQAALTYHRPLAGVLALSTYLALEPAAEQRLANQDIPIEIYHGTADSIVAEALGRRSCERLRELGYQPRYKNYPMEHSLCMEEVADISAWLQARLQIA